MEVYAVEKWLGRPLGLSESASATVIGSFLQTIGNHAAAVELLVRLDK